MDTKEVTLIIKWSGKEYPIEDLTEHDTVAVLKHEICKKTQVRPERQKLLNLKHKGKPVTDDIRLGALELKANFKVMMVGSLEADIMEASSRPTDVGSVVNDLDNEDEDNVPLENKEVYLAKINKRIKDYTIKELNPPREGKRLLVLDIDYTIFDHRSVAENGRCKASKMERFAINILHQKIQNICRLCGVDNPVKVPIVEDDDIICLDDDEVTLVKKIEECVGIKVYKTDQMPQQICSLCIDKVNDFYEYRLMCAATNVQTRTILNLPLVEPTSILIKTEPMPEPAPPEVTPAPPESKPGVKRGSKTRSRKNDNADTGDLHVGSSEKRIKTEYACQYCNEAYDASSDLERHLVVKHTPLIRKYGCGTCAELFDTATEYKDHNLWHKLTRTAYHCYRCNRKFLKSNTLNKHLEIHACVRNVRKSTSNLVPDMQCKLCTKTFKTQNLYEWHSCFLRAKANCPKCGKYFMKKNLLIRHYMLYCTGSLAPMEPVVVKEEPATLGANDLPKRTPIPEATGKTGRKRGRPRLTARFEEMKEETSELPFPPLLDLPEMKLESSSSEVASGELNAAQDADHGGDHRKRSKVTFAKEAEKINTLLRSGAGVNENSDFAQISSILTSVNEAIATISNARKRKKHKDPVTLHTVENPAGIDAPMVVLSMANMMSAPCGNPGTPQADVAPMEESEQNDVNYTAANREAHEEIDGNASNAEDAYDGESRNDQEEEGFAGYDDADSIDNMEGGGSDHEIEDSTSTVSAIHHEGASTSPHEIDTPDETQMASTVVQVKQESMTNPEAGDVGEYEMAMSCLAIKHEPVDDDSEQVNFNAVEPTQRQEQRITQSTSAFQALRIKIKKEKGLHNATVFNEESNPIDSSSAPDGPPEPERPVARQQKKPTKKATTPNHYKVRPMRSRPTVFVEPEVRIKQERPDPEQHKPYEEHGNEELENADEGYGRVAVKQEPVDCLAGHSNLDQPVPIRSSFESHADGSSEAETAFDGMQIKQERPEETSMTIWATGNSNGVTDAPLNVGGGSQASFGQNDNPMSRSGSKSKKTGTSSHKSSRRINPFALLKRKTLASENAQEPEPNEQPGASAARLSLPIIAGVTSVDLDAHLGETMDSPPFDTRVVNNNVSTTQPKDSDEREPDEEAPGPAIASPESSIADTEMETATEKESVENVITQRDATELRIVSVLTVQENEAVAENVNCVATEKADFNTELDPESVENCITSKDRDSTISVVHNESTECNSNAKVSGDDESSKSSAEKMDTGTETILPKESYEEPFSDKENSNSSPQPAEEIAEIVEKQVHEVNTDATVEPTEKEIYCSDDVSTSTEVICEEATSKVLPAQPAEETDEKVDKCVEVEHDGAKDSTEKEINRSGYVMDDDKVTSSVLTSEEATPKVLSAHPAEKNDEKADERLQEVHNDGAKEPTEKEINCSDDVINDEEATHVLTAEEGTSTVSTAEGHENTGKEHKKT
uniref:Ubiquitin-like domain-containing protein n=1 Tax=Anopheles atroparvus TaxID=41427 RepID=A0A182IJ68_ANOAO